MSSDKSTKKGGIDFDALDARLAGRKRPLSAREIYAGKQRSESAEPKPPEPPKEKPVAKKFAAKKPVPKAVAESTELSLVERIKEAHFDVEAAFGNAVQRARDVGSLLIEAKDECGHGKWLEWFAAARLPFSDRTAQSYMKLAKEWDDKIGSNPQNSADLTISAALKILSQPQGGEEDPPRIEQKTPSAAASGAAASVPASAPVVPDGPAAQTGGATGPEGMSAEAVAPAAATGRGPLPRSSDSAEDEAVQANNICKEVDEWADRPTVAPADSSTVSSAEQATPVSTEAAAASEGQSERSMYRVQVSRYKSMVREQEEIRREHLAAVDEATRLMLEEWTEAGDYDE